MDWDDIETLEDALTWLRSQTSITGEQHQNLLMQFLPSDAISDVIEQRGITITGEPGM